METELYHYGTPRHSGRYPWGSGDNPYQRNQQFLAIYRDLHSKKYTDAQIAEYFRTNVEGYIGTRFSSNDVKAKNAIAAAEERAACITRCKRLKEHGYSNVRIGEMMGVNESVVRSWLKVTEDTQKDKLQNTADALKKAVDKNGYIDIGAGVEREVNDIGVTRTNFDTAVAMLKDKGYQVFTIDIEQANNPGNFTHVKVLATPDGSYSEAKYDTSKIKSFTDYSPDGGKTFQQTEFPSSVDGKRVMIRYRDEGGLERDGTIELRRGVSDLSLGPDNYAQVRVAVDGTHYLKGMAVYGEDKDFPKGVDIIFNTNKASDVPKNEVLKTLKGIKENGEVDKTLPFGAVIKAGGQSFYQSKDGEYVKEGNTYRKATDEDTGERYALSPINKVKSEGDWDEYKSNLSAQFLSKQNKDLITNQLNLTIKNKEEEFETIKNCTNPVVKKKLLDSFASSCDSSAVDLKAAALPKQSSKVILPIADLPDNQVYAPTYKDGTEVVLIRYPHAGTFEIPKLVVNNSNATAAKMIGNDARDAIGINSKVAEQLSGADFDGDSVIVIPLSSKVKVTTSKPLEGLKNFDPKIDYKGYEGMVSITPDQKQREMGKVSNLITDMTLQGANEAELTRAVKHSMVVIDAEKHNLDYKRSEEDNAIQALKNKYQPKDDPTKPGGGAHTLISQASSDARILEQELVNKEGKKTYTADKDTGEYLYKETGRTYEKPVTKKVPIKDEDGNVVKDKKGNIRYTKEYVYNEDGTLKTKTVQAMTKTTKMASVKDAHELSSGTWQEELYADYANACKKLANEARKEALSTPGITVDKAATQAYAYEVDSLKSKLNVALKNAPRERQAQAQANAEYRQKMRDTYCTAEELDDEHKKKFKQQAIANARARVGAGKTMIEITDKEWDAIQAGAVSTTVLKSILDNTKLDDVKKRALPTTSDTGVTTAKAARMRAMQTSGYTLAEIAEQFDVSTSTVSKALKGA